MNFIVVAFSGGKHEGSKSSSSSKRTSGELIVYRPGYHATYCGHRAEQEISYIAGKF